MSHSRRQPRRPGASAAATALARVRSALREHPDHRGGILLAVSGGADSMLLLTALAPLRQEGLRVEVAWIDHGVRPEAGDEGTLVVRAGQAHGLEVHVRRLALDAGPGFEARARTAREAALEEVRASRGLALIATGHTASDQAETLLMRLSRGAALRGAAGILERRGPVIRPMLTLTRGEVRACLARLGIAWCEDAMNADPSFFRVRVRQAVLPALKAAAGFEVATGLARFAALAAEDDAWLEAEAARALARLTLVPFRADGSGAPEATGADGGGAARGALGTDATEMGVSEMGVSEMGVSERDRDATEMGVSDGDVLDSAALDAVGLRALPPPLRRRALHRWLRLRLGPLSSERLAAADAAVLRGRHCELRDGAGLACEGGRVRLIPSHPALARTPVMPPPRLLDAAEELVWEGGGGRWRLGLSHAPVAPGPAARYPLIKAPGALEVRVRQKGDRVLLWDGRTRSVADVMIDAKVPRELRAGWPVVAEVGGPVRWVPGALSAPAALPADAWLWAVGPTWTSAREAPGL